MTKAVALLVAAAAVSELEESETLRDATRELARRGYDVPAFFTGAG